MNNNPITWVVNKMYITIFCLFLLGNGNILYGLSVIPQQDYAVQSAGFSALKDFNNILFPKYEKSFQGNFKINLKGISLVDLNKPIYADSFSVLHIIIAVLVFLIVIQFLYTRFFLVGPLKKIREKLSQISEIEENYGDQIAPPFIKILSDVTRSVNAMSSTLHSYRKNMTNLVIRRVNDLETVNERLNQELQIYQSENQSLGESAAKFNMVAENPNIGIFQIDLSGKLIYTNKAFGRMFDYETDELMHIKIQTLSPARFQDDTNIKVNKFLTRDETKGELILCNRHGKEIFIYYNAWLLIENGRSFGACGFLEDISERKLEYLQLQDKEHLLHDFFNNLTAGIIYADAESRVIQDVNNTLLNLTGYTKNEIFGLNTIQAIMPEQYHIFINKKIDEVIKTGQNTEFEVSLKKKNGLLFPADVSLFILKNENIKYNYIILQIIDNTKHKQREKRLINEKKRLADYFESMIDSIIVTDIKGNNILANQSYLNLIGYPKHNLANRNSMDKLVPLDVPKLEEEFNSELYSKGYIKDKETNIKTKKGMTIPVLYSAKVLNDNTGQPVNLVGIIRDNRKRKKEQEIVKKISAQAEFTAKLLLTSAQPFVLFSKDGRCLNCNSAFCSMTGYSKSEVLKIMNIFESLTPVNWRQRETEIIQNLIMSGEPQRYIKECIRKDGTSIFIDSSLNLIPNNTNTKIYISSFMLDITKQKNKTDKIKEELKRKKQLLKQLYSMLNTDTKS